MEIHKWNIKLKIVFYSITTSRMYHINAPCRISLQAESTSKDWSEAKLTTLLGRCSSPDISYPSDTQLPPSAPVSKLEPWPVHLPRSFVFLLSWPPTALVQRSVIFRPPGVVKISIPSIRSYLAKCIKCCVFITSQRAHKSHNNHDKRCFSTKLQRTEFRTSSLEDLTFSCLRPENYRLHSEELTLSNLSTRKLIVKAPPKTCAGWDISRRHWQGGGSNDFIAPAIPSPRCWLGSCSLGPPSPWHFPAWNADGVPWFENPLTNDGFSCCATCLPSVKN